MSDVAVLVIDMMNTYRHEDAELLVPMSRHRRSAGKLISTARDRDDVDVVYVNDNYGDFTADFDDLVTAALDGERLDLVSPLAPTRKSLRVVKVCHSAFYASSLDYLLGRLETRRLIVTGQVTEQCILYTALDAYVRHFSFVVHRIASQHRSRARRCALTMMGKNMHAEIVPAEKCLR